MSTLAESREPAAAPVSCVHLLVAAQAARTPDAVAVTAPGTSLTYRDLDQRSDVVAGRLTAAGARLDRVVGVLADRSPELIVVLLGILKAGAAYLVVDPQAPADRVAYLLADAAVTTLVVDRANADRAPADVATVELAALLADGAGAVPAGGDAPAVSPANLAYVSYTSGSTGRPKGVSVAHDAVVRLVQRIEWAAFDASDVFLQLSPVSFDASTLEIWAPLVRGARLAIYPPGPVTPDGIAAAIARAGVTVLWLTAGVFHQLARTDPGALRGVRHLLAGGDVVSPQQVARVLEAVPGLLFTNGYGPTENTTFTTCWSSTVAPTGTTVPIGYPIDGTSVLLLDAQLRPVAPGAVGRLYAAGRGLARGYLNQPGLTADRFLPNPDPAAHGERMYDTGDLCRLNPDGSLDYVGRDDSQVKVRGFRIELSEIEEAARAVPGVRDAAVTTQPDGAGGKRLLCYVIAADPAVVARVRGALRDRLPTYMIPWAVLPIDALPLNPNGKVDRAALPAARRVPRDLAEPYRGAQTPTELALAQMWSGVLDVEPVGVDDDFFDLGGHSLLAAELVVAIHERFGVNVPARTLYLDATIGRLAVAIDAMLAQSADGGDLVAAVAR